MDKRMERCREGAEQLFDRIKSLPVIQQASNNPKYIFYGAVLLCLTSWLAIRAAKFLRKPIPSRPATPDLEKPAARNLKVPPRPLGGLFDIFRTLNTR